MSMGARLTSQNRGHPPSDHVSVEGHGEDDDDSWGKLLTRPPELSGSRDIWKRVG
jgi:hypothetical protein